jgi:hypothetical protein
MPRVRRTARATPPGARRARPSSSRRRRGSSGESARTVALRFGPLHFGDRFSASSFMRLSDLLSSLSGPDHTMSTSNVPLAACTRCGNAVPAHSHNVPTVTPHRPPPAVPHRLSRASSDVQMVRTRSAGPLKSAFSCGARLCLPPAAVSVGTIAAGVFLGFLFGGPASATVRRLPPRHQHRLPTVLRNQDEYSLHRRYVEQREQQVARGNPGSMMLAAPSPWKRKTHARLRPPYGLT